ncbi:hypothetical protein ABL78_4842 [Leptomonas seymouri]|uniref:Present in the outer mitochondrial membrane proteome 7 n=1 Tax=Leptomonas seymouri TaxID=5684 RepID=A0A0N1HVZ7_LEPSE|nr:hypothetical protein ABL78_4842 [Leptomonas seymouri]|eukprot:KPI86081.1 hypothetical protein ABL78_4842 [Leptomonas seymouri]
MTEGASHRKVWITAAATTALLVLLLRLRRQRRKAARKSAADATRASLLKAAQRSLLPVFVQAESLPTGWGVAPPIFYHPHSAVIPLVLPSDMAEVDRCSHLVRKVNVAATGLENGADSAFAFILCSYTGIAAVKSAEVATDSASSALISAVAQPQQKLLAHLLAHHPVLKGQFAGVPAQWTCLAATLSASETKKKGSTAAATPQVAATGDAGDAVSPVFTHIFQGPDNCVLLGGLNGSYFVVAVLMGFKGTITEAATGGNSESLLSSPKGAAAANVGTSATSTAAVPADAVMDLAGVIRGVAQATFKVPLATEAKSGSSSSSFLSAARLLGGAAFAVHRGYYRVLCVHDGRELELCVPAEVAVRSELVDQPLSTPIVSPVVARAPSKTQVDDVAVQDVLLTLTFTPSAFSAEERVEVRVTKEVLAALMEKPDEAAATLWKASGAISDTHPAAEEALKAVTARSPAVTSRVRPNAVTMVYAQPQFGLLFSVHPLSSVIYEPWMTDLPTILYYPLGENTEADGEGCGAPPLMSIEYLLELPKTWEVLKKDEEELRHNVLFHFTNWEAATVSSSMTEISGMRCVMFHEVCAGRRCRSYILPRGSTVLIVRWETAVETWEKYLPVFQQTLDTLHIDAIPITK